MNSYALDKDEVLVVKKYREARAKGHAKITIHIKDSTLVHMELAESVDLKQGDSTC